MYKIKQIPEDFVVKEIAKLKFKDKGSYSYYLLKKRDYTTADAVNLVANKLNVRAKHINFAGTKDKRAVTEQYISILNGPQRDLKLKDIELEFLGKGDERLNLGELEGNQFEITVRNLEEADIESMNKDLSRIPNYFDEQRFGFNKNNHIIGKFIIKKQFKESCALIPELKEYLEKKPNDYIGALRSLDKRILRMYVHAYQSYLFNKTADMLLKDKPATNITVPVLGFETDIKDSELRNITNKILKKENITLRDFIIREIPELSSEGGERRLFVQIKNLKIAKPEKDELNKGKKKIVVSFELSKGSYATVVVKYLLNLY